MVTRFLPAALRGRILRAVSLAALLMLLALSAPPGSAAEPFVHYKYQDYAETRDRIRVVSHHLMGHMNLGMATQLRARALVDTITGATPNGQPAPEGSDQVPLSRLEDRRTAVVSDVTHQFGNSRLTAEGAYSTEHDYLSRGIAASFVQSFFERNTDVQFGLSYVDDRIRPRFFSQNRRKLTRDFLIGVTQVLGPRTTMTVNAGYGNSAGYLSDPYKLVQKSVEIAEGLPLPLTFQENRPGSREKIIGYVQLNHLFERVRGTAETSLRLHDDDHGNRSQTFEIAWYQRVGERLVLRPNFRFYRQDAADFYFYNLDDTDIVPVAVPGPDTPHYSSDYRVSKLDSTTVGLKLVYSIGTRWSIDAAYERYDMNGRDGITPASAYPSANIITLGGRLWF